MTDNQAATVKLSPLACSAWMLEEGLEPIMQITGRDRNLMGLHSDLLAAWAFGVRTVLGLTGDESTAHLSGGEARYEPLHVVLRELALEIAFRGELDVEVRSRPAIACRET